MAKKVVKKAPTRKTTRTNKAAGSTTASTKVRAASKRATKPRVAMSPTEDRIRERAYEISCRRGGPPDPVADWFQAEQELLTEIGR